MLLASRAKEKSLRFNSADRKQLKCIEEEIESAIENGELYVSGSYLIRPNVEKELVRLGYAILTNNDSEFLIDWSYPTDN